MLQLIRTLASWSHLLPLLLPLERQEPGRSLVALLEKLDERVDVFRRAKRKAKVPAERGGGGGARSAGGGAAAGAAATPASASEAGGGAGGGSAGGSSSGGGGSGGGLAVAAAAENDDGGRLMRLIEATIAEVKAANGGQLTAKTLRARARRPRARPRAAARAAAAGGGASFRRDVRAGDEGAAVRRGRRARRLPLPQRGRRAVRTAARSRTACGGSRRSTPTSPTRCRSRRRRRWARAHSERMDCLQVIISGPRTRRTRRACSSSTRSSPPRTRRSRQGQPADDGQQHGALQPEPVQLRQGVPLAARHVGGPGGRDVERARVDLPPGARLGPVAHLRARAVLQRARLRAADGHPTGAQRSKSYSAEVRENTLRWAMLNQLRHPPNGFEKVVKAHFYLRRELVRAQLDGWEAEATQPSRISSMVREMKAELDKLDASCLR